MKVTSVPSQMGPGGLEVMVTLTGCDGLTVMFLLSLTGLQVPWVVSVRMAGPEKLAGGVHVVEALQALEGKNVPPTEELHTAPVAPAPPYKPPRAGEAVP